MSDNGPQRDADRPEHFRRETSTPRTSRRQLPWLVVGIVVLMACAIGVPLFVMPGCNRPQAQAPTPAPPQGAAETQLDGELRMVVRQPTRPSEALPIEDVGALPVRAGGSMSLQVELNEPAFVYLVWLDCGGQVVPLYPWNTDGLKVTDINQTPPLRRSAKVLQSPLLLGGGWKFGPRGGMETVLLLARSTPLDEGTRLGPLLAPLPPASMRDPEELVVFGLSGGEDSVSTLLAKNRGDEQESLAADEPLRALLLRLGEHFELVRAVRFAHQGE